MRKALSLVAALTVVASLSAGHAETTLASCSGQTELKGVNVPTSGFNPSYAGHCKSQEAFVLAETTTVTITITPGDGFSGPLHAYLKAIPCTPPAPDSGDPPCPPTPSTATQAYGSYAGGQILKQFGDGTVTGPVPAGTWQLVVDTSGTITNPGAGKGLPAQLNVVNVDNAAGAFAAAVTTA